MAGGVVRAGAGEIEGRRRREDEVAPLGAVRAAQPLGAVSGWLVGDPGGLCPNNSRRRRRHCLLSKHEILAAATAEGEKVKEKRQMLAIVPHSV